MEIIIVLIIFGLGVMYGVSTTLARIKDNLVRLSEEQEEEEAKQVIPMVFEIMDGQQTVFAYHAEEQYFLAQGDTMEELLKRIQERFPNKDLIAERDHLEQITATVTSWKTK